MAGISAVIMFFFDDRKALEHYGATETGNAEEARPDIEDEEQQQESPITGQDESNQSSEEGETPLQKRRGWIPFITFFQGLIFAIGSEMTVKFFPLFFKDDVGMRYV